MNTRIHPRVLEAMMESVETTFDNTLMDILRELLTDDVIRELSEERHGVLTESLYAGKKDPSNFTYAVQRFLEPDVIRIRKTFESLILGYASQGIIPVTQARLGEVVEQFISESGGWSTKTIKYKDAMAYRLPGSFENGKRR
jgi:hypothetical protein